MTATLVYKNLRLGNWSIAEVVGVDGRGRVVDHVASLYLRDVRFVVKESRRQAVIRTRQREVHAWCIGEVVSADLTGLSETPVSYNPYRSDSFTLPDGSPVLTASLVRFAQDGRAYILKG